jgi:hypothetical protein
MIMLARKLYPRVFNMIDFRCVCQALLSLDDNMAGKTIQCPDCHWPLVVPEVPLHRPGHCLTCDQDRPTQPSYLLLSQVEYELFFGKYVRQAFFKCFLCDQCYSRLNWLYYLQFVIVFASIAAMAVFGLIGIVIASFAAPGKASALHTAAFVSFFILAILSVPVGCIRFYFYRRRKMAEIVSPTADRALDSLGVATDRGSMPVLVVCRSLPATWQWWLLLGRRPPPVIDPLAAEAKEDSKLVAVTRH